MALTATRRQQLDRLLALQNNGLNDHVDIMTITGFMNDAQVDAHIASYERNQLKHMLTLKPKKTA